MLVVLTAEVGDIMTPGMRSAVLPLQASSVTPRPRVVLMPFDLPDYITAWTPADNDVLEAAIVAALRQSAKITIATAPSGTETPRDRAAIAKVGRALRADYLLEGGVSEFGSGQEGPSAGSALQIAFQLFDGRTGALVWVDEANASSAATSRSASVREMSQSVARVVAARVAQTSF